MNFKKCFICVLVGALSVSTQMSSKATITKSMSSSEEVSSDSADVLKGASEDASDLKDEEKMSEDSSNPTSVVKPAAEVATVFINDGLRRDFKLSQNALEMMNRLNDALRNSAISSDMRVVAPIINNIRLKDLSAYRMNISAPALTTTVSEPNKFNASKFFERPAYDTMVLAPETDTKLEVSNKYEDMGKLLLNDLDDTLKVNDSKLEDFYRSIAKDTSNSVPITLNASKSEPALEVLVSEQDLLNLLIRLKDVATESQLSKIRVDDKNTIDFSQLSEDEVFDLLRKLIPTEETQKRPLQCALVEPPKKNLPEKSCGGNDDTIKFYKTGDVFTVKFLSVLASMAMASLLGVLVMSRKRIANLLKKFRLFGFNK